MDDESCLFFVMHSFFFFRLLLEFTFLLDVCVSKLLGKTGLISHGAFSLLL